MKNLKNIIILSVMVSSMMIFQGCDSDRPEAIVKQNGLVLSFYRNAAGELVVDEEESACFERDYKFSIDYVGVIGAQKDRKIEECDGIIGYLPDEYKKVSKYQELVREKIKENQEELVEHGILALKTLEQEVAK